MKQKTFASFYDWYEATATSKSKQAKATIAQQHLGGTLGVRLIHSRGVAGEYTVPPVASLQLHLSLKRTKAQVDVGSGIIHPNEHKGQMIVAPELVPCHYTLNGDFALLCCEIPTASLHSNFDGLAKNDSFDLGELHDAYFKDPLIEGLLFKLWTEASSQQPFGSLFIDHTTYTLVSALLYKSQSLKKRTLQDKGLSKKQLKQIADHIRDRLAESLSLQDLASVLGIQAWELARAFKKTTGMPPYKYVLQQRVHRAKELLETTTLPLAQIAFIVGFSSQAHFTSIFKKVLGYVPSDLRKKTT